MSKIGKQAILLSEDIKVEPTEIKSGKASSRQITISGKLGQTQLDLPSFLEYTIKENRLFLSCRAHDNRRRAFYGLYRSLINNAIIGCSQGFEKKLKIQGVGYNAKIENNEIILNVGYSHPVKVEIPKNLEATVQKNIISIKGIDKQAVGQFAAKIRSIKKPDAYKGKGIRYLGEEIKLKAGKVAKSVGA